jgi:MFS family permease
VNGVGTQIGRAPRTSCTPVVIKRSLFQLAAIIIAGAAANYASATVGPLQESMRIALGLTDNQIAVLQGPALYLPPVALGIPLGFLIDRFSRARLLVVFTALEILGCLATACAPTFAILLGARALIGSMLSGNAMNASALVAEFVSPEQRGRTLMILGIAQVAGMSAAFVLGGKLVALYGADSNSWRWAMLWLALPLVPVLVLTWWVREPQREDGGRRKMVLRCAFAGLWRHRAMLLPLSFGQVIMVMGYMGSLVWSAPILARNFHLPPDQVGAIMGLVLLTSGLLGPLLGGVLVDLCQRTGGLRRTVSLMIVLALLQVPFGFYALMPTVLWVGLLLGALCTISSMKGIICTTATTVAIPEEFLGLSFGVMNAISAVFVSLSPVAVSLLAGRTGSPSGTGRALTTVCVVTSLLGAATFAAARHYFPPGVKEPLERI